MKKYDTFVFDMDGTLVDTGDCIVEGLKGTQKELNLKQLDDKTLRLFLGPPFKESIMKYYGVTYEDCDLITEVYRKHYLESGIQKTRIFDDVHRMLKGIRSNGAKVAVATIKQWQLAKKTLEMTGIADEVDYIALNLDNSMGDKAAQIKECVEALGCKDYSHAVMIGDAPNDGRAAAEAGVDFIALGIGEGFKKEGALDSIEYVYVAADSTDLCNFTLNCSGKIE